MSYKNFVNKYYFPLSQAIKKENIAKYLRQLEKSQYYSLKELQNLQLKKLILLLLHTQQNVPYYRHLFNDHHIEPQNIQSINDLKNIPYLTKDIIKHQKENLHSQKKCGKIYPCTTSGSTGESLNFTVTSEYSSWDWASRWRARSWYNVNIGDREFAIWGRPVYSKISRLFDPVKAILRNTILVDGFNVSDQRLDKYCRLILLFKPDYIYGYSFSVFQLANYLNLNYPDKQISGIKAIFVTAEMLYPHQRKIVEDVFNAPVSNEYGCSEIGGFAYECQKGNWHISAENVIIESISIDDGPKEFVLTSLTNYYMPFIRYRIGDLGELSEATCSCGVNLPLLKFNAGKTTDIIILKNGRKLTSEIFLYLTRAMVEHRIQPFKKFRVIQKDYDLFTILYEDKQDISDSLKEKFTNLFLNLLKTNNIMVLFQKVDHIPIESTGKMRYFISELNKGK